MLPFAREQELSPVFFDPAKLIVGMEDMLKASIGPGIQITLDLGPSPYLIRADPNQIELAILNLALNARDAMPQGGKLTIKLHAEKVDASAQPLSAGEYVCISIIDTGIGMDEVTLKRAAEPFFTTKGVAKGTGLGLSMVYGLAAVSDGWIRMSSQPGHGTTVELFFPLSESNPSVEPAMQKQPVTMVDTPRCILVVDDDVLVGESISEMLSDLGHTAYVAYSGAAALELIYEHAEIELVLTDHAMPEMTGIELASLSRKFKPSLPIVLGTGYAGPSEGTDLQLLRLSKPYRQDDLRSLIASIFSTK